MIWGINFIVVKLVLRDFSPLAFIGLRFGLATVVMLFFLWQRARRRATPTLLDVPRRDASRVILSASAATRCTNCSS